MQVDLNGSLADKNSKALEASRLDPVFQNFQDLLDLQGLEGEQFVEVGTRDLTHETRKSLE